MSNRMTAVHEVEAIKFTWSVTWTEFDTCLTSKRFSASWCKDSKWHLVLYPKGKGGYGHYNLVLNRECCAQENDVKVRAGFVFQGPKTEVKYCDFQKIFRGTSSHDIARNETSTSYSRESFSLQIYCWIEVEKTNSSDSENALSDDFKKLLGNEEFRDVTIRTAEKEFRVLKALLWARSDVFAAMFSHSMKEKEDCIVEITDVAPDVLEQLIEFIYTGKCSKQEEMATELMVAADKYQIKHLKDKCMEELSNHLTVDNAAEMLMLADLHSAETLKKRALAEIASEPLKVSKTDGWKKMASLQPHLIHDVFIALAAWCDKKGTPSSAY